MSAPGKVPVTLVDLGLGNVRSVARALERAGGRPEVTSDPAAVRTARRLVVPGQGAFRDAADVLDRGLGAALQARLDAGVPYLGICLGMQMLFESSEESPGAAGLGVIAGSVVRLPLGGVVGGQPRKVPHMGWNRVSGRHPLLATDAWFYFTHSFVCRPADPDVIVGTADYGGALCAAVAAGPVFGCQFHPEKSQRAGTRLLAGFLGAEPSA